MKRHIFVFTCCILTFFLLATVSRSYAAPVVVTSRADLSGNDFIDWGSFGPEFTTVSNPSGINSNSGIVTATVSMPSGDFLRVNQGTSWTGNFNPGDRLLWTNFEVGPMVISFDKPVSTAGGQIQSNSFGPFTATLNVYDASNTLIGSFTLDGDSTSNADNSAIFLGVRDTSATIKRIEYSVVIDNEPADFALNRLDIIDPPSAIPTMTEWGMLIFTALAGLTSIYFLKRKREEFRS